MASQNGWLSPHTRGDDTTAQLRQVVSGEFGRWGATFNTIATSGGNDIVHSDCAVQHERIRLMVQASKLYEVTLLVAYQLYFHEVMGIKHQPDSWAAAFDRVKLVPNFEYPIHNGIPKELDLWRLAYKHYMSDDLSFGDVYGVLQTAVADENGPTMSSLIRTLTVIRQTDIRGKISITLACEIAIQTRLATTKKEHEPAVRAKLSKQYPMPATQVTPFLCTFPKYSSACARHVRNLPLPVSTSATRSHVTHAHRLKPILSVYPGHGRNNPVGGGLRGCHQVPKLVGRGRRSAWPHVRRSIMVLDR